jgi:hypothetical protein
MSFYSNGTANYKVHMYGPARKHTLHMPKNTDGREKIKPLHKHQTTTTKMSFFGFFLPGIYNKCQLFYILLAYIF